MIFTESPTSPESPAFFDSSGTPASPASPALPPSQATENATQKTPTLGNGLVGMAISAPLGALFGGVRGSLGQFSLFFVNPALAGMAGSFSTFASIGALYGPLVRVPITISRYYLEKNSFLKQYPNLKEFLRLTSDLLLDLGAMVAAATILGFPLLGASVICMMILPTVIYTLNALALVLKTCLSTRQDITGTAIPTVLSAEPDVDDANEESSPIASL